MTTVFWGDSHAEGGAGALRGQNMGISGAQLDRVRREHPVTSIPRGSTVAIQIGTNDIYNHPRWSDAQIQGHARSTINTALEMKRAGLTPVVFAIPIPERPYTDGDWTEASFREFQANARVYNDALRREAAANGINFVPFQPNTNDFSSDNLHLTANGYRRMFALANGVSFSPPPPRPATAPDVVARPAPADAAAPPPPAPLPPPVFTPALNTAVTAFLTGDATAAEITALKGAAGVTDSNPGQLDGRGGVNGALTLERTRTALGGPLSATNHPDLYALATARYTALTGLPADRQATPAEVDASEARIRTMTPAQRAEYQSVSYLLGFNDTRLSNGQINVDGVYGERTEASIAAGNTALHPTATSSAASVESGQITVASAADARAAFPVAASGLTTGNRRLLIIDIGHNDRLGPGQNVLPGAVANNGTTEVEMATIQANALRRAAEAQGYTVAFTNEPGRVLDMPGTIGSHARHRGETADQIASRLGFSRNNTVMVSLHWDQSAPVSGNANATSEASRLFGSKVLYEPSDTRSTGLAQSIAATYNPNRIAPNERDTNGLSARPNLGIFNGGNTPTVLIESGFMSPQDSRYRESIRADGGRAWASQILGGLNNFFGGSLLQDRSVIARNDAALVPSMA